MKEFDYVVTAAASKQAYQRYFDSIICCIKHFRAYYSDCDKRLKTTKKKPLVRLYRHGGKVQAFIEMWFNRKRYAQIYTLSNGETILH